MTPKTLSRALRSPQNSHLLMTESRLLKTHFQKPAEGKTQIAAQSASEIRLLSNQGPLRHRRITVWQSF